MRCQGAARAATTGVPAREVMANISQWSGWAARGGGDVHERMGSEQMKTRLSSRAELVDVHRPTSTTIMLHSPQLDPLHFSFRTPSRAEKTWHNERARRRTCTHLPAGAPPRGALMSASTPPPGGGPEPAPPAPPQSAGADDDHDDFSPLLDLLERFPGLFQKYVLEQLDPAARASLAVAARAFLGLVYPRSIFPLGPPRAQMTAWVVKRVFKLVDFLGTSERLAWAKANGCPWVAETCALRCTGRAPCGAAVVAAARLPVERGDVLCAALHGHLALLQWAREHDCPWGEGTCYLASRGGHLQVLKWAREHGCPWNKRACEDVSRYRPETLAWVRHQPE